MRIALVAPPFIPVPPRRYGGTELFIANLANGLHARGQQVTVYANGESRLRCAIKWRYPKSDWPIGDPMRSGLKNADHTAWAIHDAAQWADVLHLNDVVGVPFTRFIDQAVTLTLHHPYEPALSEQYERYPDIDYVAIAEWLGRQHAMSKLHVVHHGIPVDEYRFSREKDEYVAFLGRMAPCKGAHVAVEVARRAGIRLKLAGEVQPCFQSYWDDQVLPHVDGSHVQYVGEVDHARKNDLLSRAKALLFPIQWEEPFGLVLVEAMACGTPVLAFNGGAVEEIVHDGMNGWICADVDDMADRLAEPLPDSRACRQFVERSFSLETMVDRYLSLYENAVRVRPGGRAALEAGWKT